MNPIVPGHGARQLVMRNTSAHLVATAVSLGLGLISAGIISRHLGVAQFGKFNYLFAFYYFFLTLNDWGINTVLVREISRDKRRSGEILGSILFFKLIVALLSLLLARAIILQVGFEDDLRRGLLLYGLILPLAALQLPAVAYQAHLQLARLSLLSILNRVLVFIFTILSVWFGFGITGLAGALILAETGYSLLVLKDCRSLVQPVLKWNLNIVRPVLRSSIPVGITGLLVAVINRTNFLLLERSGDLHQLGLFSAASKIATLLQTLPLAVMTTLYPLMSRYAAEDFGRLKLLYWKSFWAMALAGVGVAVFIACFSSPLVRLIFGQGYTPAALSLAVLVWSTTFAYPAICGGNLLLGLGYEKTNLLINLSAVGLSLFLNFHWIPRWGALGASWATTLTYGWIFICTTIAAQRALQTRP